MSSLVNNENLAEICDRVGLTACLNLNPAAGGYVNKRLKATTLEAAIGAVFEDSDLQTVESVMANLGISMIFDDTVMFKTVPFPLDKHQTHLVCIDLEYFVSPLYVWQSLQGNLLLQTSCRFPLGTARRSKSQLTAHLCRSYLRSIKSVT